jgi:restriction system protein
MTLWMNRAGKLGEWESNFLQDQRIYLQWSEIDRDLGQVADKAELRAILEDFYPGSTTARINNFLGQLWSFVKSMSPGDWVALPSKTKRVIHFGEVKGPYVFDPSQEPDLRQFRAVHWFALDIPRTTIPQDILYSFGPMTICRIEGEDRIRAISKSGWKPESGVSALTSIASAGDNGDESRSLIDLEASARDAIAELIIRKFKGHGMAWLVEKVLQAQGYKTFRSPEGPDHGIDLLAAPGPLGYGQPRIVVQVKSGDTPVDRPTVDQLVGVMHNVQADLGLFVSWGGFKSSVDRENARQFFRVRLWDQNALIDQILEHYDKLDEDLRAELPLKRIWTVAQLDDENS